MNNPVNLPPSMSSCSNARNGSSHPHDNGLRGPEAETSRCNNNILRLAFESFSHIRWRRPMVVFKHPLEEHKTGSEAIVEFDGAADPYQPLNWPRRKKVITVVLYGLTTMVPTWASSVYAPGVQQISIDFNVNREISTLGISLTLFGFGLGPLLWAPISEIYGRKPAVLIPYFIAVIFSFATGAAKDIQTVLLTRFFAGFFGSAPVTNTGGVLSDLFPPEKRGLAVVAYAMTIVGGPIFGPIVGGAIVQSYLKWRWTQYITGIMMISMLILDVLILDESYPPVLLVYKARWLRHQTGNWALHARHEEWDVGIGEMARKYLLRPFQLLATPICFFVTLYSSFVYAILYADLAAFPYVFETLRGWNLTVGALPFLALFLGICFGAIINLTNQRYYIARFIKNERRAIPEARLPPMMVGSLFLASGLFIFAWTADPTIPWIAPNVGIACVGLGFFTIFQASLNYLIDTFPRYAASAVAASSFLRSMFAGAFPLIIDPLLYRLGAGWGISIFGFLAVVLIPIPYILFLFGKRVRAKGAFSQASV